VQDGIADFRSLTYSLANEERAKQKAVADAMHRAIGRATAALEQSKQKLGPARYVNLEVRNLVGAKPIEMAYVPGAAETIEVTSGGGGGGIFPHAKKPRSLRHLCSPASSPSAQPFSACLELRSSYCSRWRPLVRSAWNVQKVSAALSTY